MKKTLLIVLVFSFTSFCNAQSVAKLTGEIKNANSEKVYLYTESFENRQYARTYLDSAKVEENGTFELTAKLDSLTEVVFYDGEESMGILLAPEDEISLSLNTLYFDETLNFSGKGSEKNNAIVTLYLVNEINNSQLFNYLQKEDIDTTQLFEVFNKNSGRYISLVKDYMSSVPNFKMHGKSLVENEEMNKKQFKNYIRSEVEFKAQMKKIINQPAIDFEGIDLGGKTAKLSDYMGKITVIDFWATWCGPCKAEFPAYKELEKKYGENVNFVSVAVWCEEDGWKEMAKTEGFKNNIFISRDKQKQLDPYVVKSIPRYIVLDENFNVIDADAPRPSSGELEKYWVK